MTQNSVPAQDGASLLGILDELTEVVLNAKPVPMSASVRVNRAELLELVDAAKSVVPTTVHRAESIVAEAEDTVTRARMEADRLVRDAAERADAVLAEAQQEANRRREAAEEGARETILRARRQADELIADERVSHLAEHRAREIVAEARAEAARLADNANIYCDERLAAFGDELEDLRRQVAGGRDAIARRRREVEVDLQSAYSAAEAARAEQADDPALRVASATYDDPSGIREHPEYRQERTPGEGRGSSTVRHAPSTPQDDVVVRESRPVETGADAVVVVEEER